MQGDLETSGPVGQVGNWIFMAFFCITQGRRCLSGLLERSVSLANYLLPFGTSWSQSFKSHLSMITLTAIRVRDKKSNQWLIPADRGWWRGPQHHSWPWEDHHSRSFSSPSGASVVLWILGESKQTWQINLKCKVQTQVRE
jgi:hypothetical protein